MKPKNKKKRPRTNMSGLVVHAKGSTSIMSEESILRKKFKNGNITKEELRRLASFMVVAKRGRNVNIEINIKLTPIKVPRYYVKCWDKWIQCTKVQYDTAPQCARKIIYTEI